LFFNLCIFILFSSLITQVLPRSVSVAAFDCFDGSSTRFSSIQVKGPSRRFSIILVKRLVYVSPVSNSCKRFRFHVSHKKDRVPN